MLISTKIRDPSYGPWKAPKQLGESKAHLVLLNTADGSSTGLWRAVIRQHTMAEDS